MSAWPTELVFRRAARTLHISFDDGAAFDIPFETLRVESPSAEVQGHGPGQKRAVTGKAGVGVIEARPVGRYAVRIVFDDGHDTGIYAWDYLRALGETART
ncbi:MAG: DUF971 domain-containing protein [Hyphomonadaceae bacterium]|nr:DUF971 domain-containing protein [Hyphomonadaceae bacterium]